MVPTCKPLCAPSGNADCAETDQAKSGSVYERYEATHASYNLTRLPIGAQEIINHLSADKSLASLRLLDAGCGTGLYLESLVKAKTGSLLGVDASHEGIRQSALRLGNAPNVALEVGDLRALSAKDASFDAALYNFVLHHLDRAADGYEQLSLALTEAYRVLDCNGVLIIGTCSQEQLAVETGWAWYAPYFPEAARALAARFAPLEKLCSLLQQVGFDQVQFVYPGRCDYTAQSFDPTGPFRPEWRAGDSMFAHYNDHSDWLARDLARLQIEIDSGAVLERIRSAQERAEKIRQVVFVTARRNQRLR